MNTILYNSSYILERKYDYAEYPTDQEVYNYWNNILGEDLINFLKNNENLNSVFGSYWRHPEDPSGWQMSQPLFYNITTDPIVVCANESDCNSIAIYVRDLNSDAAMVKKIPTKNKISMQKAQK